MNRLPSYQLCWLWEIPEILLEQKLTTYDHRLLWFTVQLISINIYVQTSLHCNLQSKGLFSESIFLKIAIAQYQAVILLTQQCWGTFYRPFEEFINTFLGRKQWFMTSCFILKLRNIPKFRSYSLLVGWYASKCHLLFIWYFFLTFVISNFQILKKFRISKFLQLSNVISKLIKNVISFRFWPDFDFFLRSTCPEFQP